MSINLTLIGQMIAFVVFVFFCAKFVWPPLTAALAERQKRIADGLEAADKANRDLEQAQEKVAEQLKEAKAQAASIIDQANKRANQIVEEAKEQGREEGQRMIAGAQAEIEQEFNRAKEQLRLLARDTDQSRDPHEPPSQRVKGFVLRSGNCQLCDVFWFAGSNGRPKHPVQKSR